MSHFEFNDYGEVSDFSAMVAVVGIALFILTVFSLIIAGIVISRHYGFGGVLVLLWVLGGTGGIWMRVAYVRAKNRHVVKRVKSQFKDAL